MNTACPITVMLTIGILKSVKDTAKIQGKRVFIININYIHPLCTTDKRTFESQRYGESLENSLVGFIKILVFLILFMRSLSSEIL